MLSMGDVVAIVGAVNGSAALILSVLQEIRHRRIDRAELRLSARVYGGEPYLAAVNAGRRGIKVNSLFAVMSDGKEKELRYPSGALPMTLEEGQDKVLHAGSAEYEGDVHLVGFYLLDSLGKRWPIGRKEFNALKRDGITAHKKKSEKEAAERTARETALKENQARAAAEEARRVAATKGTKGKS